jgi:hypothetical protein
MRVREQLSLILENFALRHEWHLLKGILYVVQIPLCGKQAFWWGRAPHYTMI